MTQKTHFRILVVDDQAVVCGALAALLDLEDDMTVVSQAHGGREAIEKVELLLGSSGVDVVLLDVEMKDMDGITTCSALHTRFPDVHVLMLTTFGRPGYVARALEAGAHGFLVKDTPVDQLTVAIRQVAAGKRVIDPLLAMDALTFGESPLTDREVEVLRNVSEGGTVADVSIALHLKQGTVRNHISSIMLKTAARTRAEAVRIATERGWL